jgi:nucleotide-binding universal stress UspA family protein
LRQINCIAERGSYNRRRTTMETPMKIRALLPLVTYPDAATDALAAGAVGAAKLFGAELHALALTVDVPDVSNALSRMMIDVKGMERAAEKRSRDHGARLIEAVERAAKAAGVAATTDTVRTAPELSGDAAAVQARYCDFAILVWEGAGHASREVAEAVMFGSGRPVLLLAHGKAPAALGHIAVAWDGSRAAARALGDAMALLVKATKVTVLTVLDEKPLAQDAGTRLADELARRGLPASFKAIRAEDQPVDTTLQEHALEAGADLLVMGAFGHSRLRDFVLGGATKGVLTDLRMPAMLSH